MSREPHKLFGALPVAQLRIGLPDDAHVQVGFDLPAGSTDNQVALVPVRRQGDRLGLYRHEGPEQPQDPQPADIYQAIQVWPTEQLPLSVATGRWAGTDCHGVLVLLLDYTGWPRILAKNQAAIARAIANALNDRPLAELELAVVPRSAIEPPSRPRSQVAVPSAAAERSVGEQAVGGPLAEEPSADERHASAPALCFALASCQYPPGILDGTPQAADGPPGPADASCRRLVDRLDAASGAQPMFVVLTGDQVYVDRTAGLFDPESVADRYRVAYELNFERRVMRDLRRRVPLCMLPDDHEITDNFELDSTSWPSRQARQLGVDAYARHQRQIGPLPILPPGPAAGPVHCALPLGGYDFFFADTRTQRQARTANNVLGAAIMDRTQMDALLAWLGKDNPSGKPRFVVSASALLPRRLSSLESDQSALRSDAWDGYPASMRQVLDCISTQARSDIVFLSGDMHRCCVATATLLDRPDTAAPVQVHSIHSSGLYAPFPFANASRADFADCDEIQTGRTRWQVAADLMPAGDGFCVVTVTEAEHGWIVAVEFDLDCVAPPVPPLRVLRRPQPSGV